MPQLSLSHVHKTYDGPTVLDDVTVDVERGEKIGVIGRNGCGKSTVLRMIAELAPTQGDVIRQKGLRIAYQAQELSVGPGTTVRDEMRRVFTEAFHREERMRELEARLAEADGDEQAELLQEYARLQALQEAQGGYGVEQRIEAVLTGLGLDPKAWDQPLEIFSGGERNVIGLARILLSDPEVILLDEPSNHLDMDGIEWFIRWVKTSPATIIMVSHDRHLLDACVGNIWEVDRGRLTAWVGAYSEYQQQKAEALALQERQYKNQQRIIQRLEFQARRLKDMARAYDDPGQAKRAQAMLKRIERMDKVEKPTGDERSFHASLSGGSRHGQIALTIDGYSKAFGDRVLFEDAGLELTHGQRVALVGPNGSGKSTLFRDILAEGSWENPTIRLGASVVVGDYNQFHEDAMDPSATLVEWVQGVTGLFHQPATELLHRFLFTRDDLDRQIKTLSGGEKSRLQLARLAHAKVNFLMLDEPTNHLDIQAAEQLERMLEEFDGTLLIISHDRYFLEKLVDVVVEVRDRNLATFRGSFAEWWRARSEQAATRGEGSLQLSSRKTGAADKAPSEQKLAREERKAQQREQRKLENRVKKLEGRMEELEEEKAQRERELEAAYSPGGNADDGPKLTARLAAIETEMGETLEEWEAASEQLEILQSQPS